jgi:single-strand DNA-binding protein
MKNRAELIGRLGSDPEIRRTQDGRPIANFTLATSETWRDKATGEKRERTEWHRVVIFSEGPAKVAEQYLKKGALVAIEGKIQTREWEDQTGVKRYTTEIVLTGYDAALHMLGSPGGNRPPPAEGEGSYGARPTGGRQAAGTSPASTAPDYDDEIPF